MFLNSHNSAEEEEEDPPIKLFTPYSKNSFTSLTRKYWIVTTKRSIGERVANKGRDRIRDQKLFFETI